jgi:hypothetical protein
MRTIKNLAPIFFLLILSFYGYQKYTQIPHYFFAYRIITTGHQLKHTFQPQSDILLYDTGSDGQYHPRA